MSVEFQSWEIKSLFIGQLSLWNGVTNLTVKVAIPIQHDISKNVCHASFHEIKRIFEI